MEKIYNEQTFSVLGHTFSASSELRVSRDGYLAVSLSIDGSAPISINTDIFDYEIMNGKKLPWAMRLEEDDYKRVVLDVLGDIAYIPESLADYVDVCMVVDGKVTPADVSKYITTSMRRAWFRRFFSDDDIAKMLDMLVEMTNPKK